MRTVEAACRAPFLIVAGVAKAGTTSLFSYFSGHPQVAACRVKEPWYFLPQDIPFPTRPRIALDPIAEYLALFPAAREGLVRLEASANYFHYPDVAQVISRALPNARIVVSLREPIGRLASQFQMGVLRGWMPASTSFDAFVDTMFRMPEAGRQTPFNDWYMLEEGLYTARLARWLDVFGPDRLLTVWFDDLQRSPQDVALQIARFAGLDEGYFRNRSYVSENAAMSDLAPWLRAAFRRMLGLTRGRWRTVLTKLTDPLRGSARRWLVRPAPPPTMTPSTRERLTAFYRDDVAALARLIGQTPPWSAAYPGTDSAPRATTMRSGN